MRKLLPIGFGSLALAAGAWYVTRPDQAQAQRAPAPELVRYGDVIVDLGRVIAVTHQRDEFVRFTLDSERPDGAVMEVVLSKEMSAEPGYVEQNWLKVVKDLRVGN
jgi:hypothetical protein